MVRAMHAPRTSPTEPVVLRSWAYGQIAATLVLCTDDQAEPGREDIEAWLARLAVADFDQLLVHSRGVPMSARDRSRFTAFWSKSERTMPPIALLTDSLAVRTVTTAFQWLTRNASLKTFAGDEVEDALRWLGSEAPPTQVRDLISRLGAALRAKRERGTSQVRPKVRLDDDG